MGFLKRFYQHIFACLMAGGLVILAAFSAQAGTISQYVSYNSAAHQEMCAGCSITGQFTLSTNDGWQTADIQYVVTGTFPPYSYDRLSALSVDRLVGDRGTDYDYNTAPGRPFDTGIDLATTSAVPVTASFTGGFYGGGLRPAWDVLTNGLLITQTYFGFEFSASAIITFDDRMITSYMFDLWGSDAPAVQVGQTSAFARSFAPAPQVPLPAPVFALLSALGLLGWVKRRRA